LNRLESLTRHRTARKLESSAAIQSQLNEAKAMQSEAKKRLGLLRREKAEMPESVHFDRKLDHLINAIKTTEGLIADIPFRIDVLKVRLAESQEREAVKRKVLKSYRKSQPTSEIKKKSNLLLRRLKLAEETNSELLKLQKERIETEKATGEKINVDNVCGGFESLHILLALCEKENSGEGRKTVTWDAYPFQKL